MASKTHSLHVPTDQLRWTLAPKSLPFSSTADLEPHQDIIGQKRGVEAFRFGMGMTKKGYNIFVTGASGSGRLATVKKLLKELSRKDEPPEDLCYVNDFKRQEAPLLLQFQAGKGAQFKKAVEEFLDTLKRDLPQLFESEEYIARKNAIHEAHEKKVREFYKDVEDKVKDTDLVVVNMQMGPVQRPDILPLVDGEPKRLVELEEMVENGRFPKKEFESLKERRAKLKEELDFIVQQVRGLQKDVSRKHDEVDRLMFMTLAQDLLKPVKEEFPGEKVDAYCEAMLEHMASRLDELRMIGAKAPQGAPPIPMMAAPSPDVLLRPYKVNLLVDNSELEGPPVIIESYPTYRNLFGSIERIMEPGGGWRTDFTKIKAGSFIKANGGYLVINLLDAIMEPGVWQTLKRSLKTEEIEIQTYDPYYFLTATGLKPEPIPMNVKVVVLGDARIYSLLRYYDEDMEKIFKVRADYESSMDRSEDTILQVARFIRSEQEKEGLRHFDASGVCRIMEQAVRMAGRQEKMSTAFPVLADLLAEANFFAQEAEANEVTAEHVDAALSAKIYRTNQIEERLQEMIDRGSLFVDTSGKAVGQVNGLAVYSMGDYMFGKPSRITAVTSLGRDGIINIEREAKLSGPTHNKGMLILSGYLRHTFAQNKPLSLTASITFEQSYGGIDGDSASSTELYALLSSLSGKPLRQDIAVTGSVNQRGEVQPIGGVNEKIEGFYLCCKHAGLTGEQGVMIPRANVKDLMLRPDVVEAIDKGDFHVWAVENIDEGIELLTGTSAGKRKKDGTYPKTTIYGLVDAKLRELAEELQKFGKDDEDNGKGKSRTKKDPPESPDDPGGPGNG